VALSAVLLTVSLRNPRLMLREQPDDVRRRPRRRLLPSVGMRCGRASPSSACCSDATGGNRRRQAPAANPLVRRAFANAFVVMVAFDVLGWLVLDRLVFCTPRPRGVVLPSTEGVAGYMNYGMPFRGFLIGLRLALPSPSPSWS